MNRSKCRAAALLLAAFVALSPCLSQAFTIPERLEFDLTWIGIKAGTAVLEVKHDGEDCMKIVSTARSAGFVSVFYKVRDRVESRVDGASSFSADVPWLPLTYHKRLREGSYRKDREVIFDREGGKAVLIDHRKKEQKEFDIPSVIHDPLSSFYLLRTMDLKVGKSVYLPVFDEKRIWDVEVQVLRKERIKVPLGTFDTIVIRPLLGSEGIFSRKGDVHIWVTDDARKMPVKLSSKVALGSVKAVLTGRSY